MDLGNARAMKGWAEGEKAALLQLFMRLKPSVQKRRQWAEWLGDIKARDGADLKAFLQERFGGFATQQREEEARGELFAARFPKLAATLRRQSELIKSLSLPDGITLTFDSSLEDPAAVFRLDFSSLEHLREQLTELLAIVSSSARLNKIFLSESPDP